MELSGSSIIESLQAPEYLQVKGKISDSCYRDSVNHTKRRTLSDDSRQFRELENSGLQSTIKEPNCLPGARLMLVQESDLIFTNKVECF